MHKIKIGINGFGRIGRRLLRLLHNHESIEVVAINDIAPLATMAHLIKYDSIHGIFNAHVAYNDEDASLIIDEKPIAYYSASSLALIPWDKHQVDIVIEATGKFKTYPTLIDHLKPGVKRVILSVPPVDELIKMLVIGVNEQTFNPKTDQIISNASCTTNNAAPMLKVVKDLCGIKQAYITTVHSYTTDQSLHDQPHRDLRRSRAAGQSIVPTTTGAAKALTKIFPDLGDVIGGCGIRVPVPNGSLTDVTINVARETTAEAINQAFKTASNQELKGILEYTELPLVSIDIVGNPHSCIVDGQMTSVIGNLVKLIGWYDNETGYSCRLIDLITFVTEKS